MIYHGAYGAPYEGRGNVELLEAAAMEKPLPPGMPEAKA
ncbi:MAG: hypothetical protein ETSY2_37235 [Candidatus Entotheonella gemina]|uniref:Uncharacterized protein n=1 Tax=Candidatus Entotheonella gemina TaxID=1429439 RepID=W4LUQ1_9BACT|nr:MAG: hypothetical protein ETSY2_37235 [Candidatus Entotheonella gemina]